MRIQKRKERHEQRRPRQVRGADRCANRRYPRRTPGWPLPKTFAPDCGISFDGRKDDEWNENKTWPNGTNLLTATEARAMLEHVIGASTPAPAAVTDDELRKMWRDAGGRFHGPHIETGTMPESLLLPFLRNLATRTPEPPISLDWTEDEQWVRSQLQRMILSSRVLVGSDGTVTGYQIKTGALHKLIGRFTVNVPLGLPELAASPTPDEQRAQAAQEDVPLWKLAYEAFDDYWQEDCKGSEQEAWQGVVDAIRAALAGGRSAQAAQEDVEATVERLMSYHDVNLAYAATAGSTSDERIVPVRRKLEVDLRAALMGRRG